MKRPDPEAVRARKQALQARQAELREHLNQKRATLADRRKAAPNRPPEQRSRCWPLCAVLAALLLACLLKDCRCDPEVVEPPAPVAIARPEPTSTEPVEDPVPPPPVRRRGRPSAPPVAAGPLPWLEAFQLQVAARSPRLAACFEGAASPGTLKWTALVEPASGRVTDQKVETMLGSAPLSRDQRNCVLEVLARPGYDLGETAARATPTRVSLVIEF